MRRAIEPSLGRIRACFSSRQEEHLGTQASGVPTRAQLEPRGVLLPWRQAASSASASSPSSSFSAAASAAASDDGAMTSCLLSRNVKANACPWGDVAHAALALSESS
ncbi:hypothetical protein ONZ51_g13010 [Trametes cubensis]|uniref:Uncharacterized protein n=1 Tax=Trametes cubensis TaxID=1111947 RepID=A0AAD7TET0_9APHY|nr:hypothetical protein ONZ51_g13010 [Trametes cubensis]